MTEPLAPLSYLARGRGRYPAYTRQRLADFARRLRRAIYPAKAAVVAIEIAGPTGRIGFEEAAGLDYRPAEIGQSLGPLWSTWWFRITAHIPPDWAGARVDMHWDSASEALLWRDGRSLAGLNIGRHQVRLTDAATGGERPVFHIEVACNRAFGADHGGGRRGGPDEPYALRACELRRFDPEAWRLFHDFETLRELEADRAPAKASRSHGAAGSGVLRPALDTTWAGRLLHDLNRVCNLIDPEAPASWPAARPILDGLLSARNADVTHDVFAIGHAHIDTAWLWPIEETRRKCQRTFATAVALMDDYPAFRFACSQAYQYAEIERTDPDLFARIKAKAATGQWLPIGGSWVEPDCNLPSGESLCRQFLYGQRYFERTFGRRSTVFWNPDVFGYAGQLPQLMREAGMSRFLTQKLSWNRFTSPPHHSFLWRGIDGSEVVTHFPPADTYNGMATMEELRYHAANYKDADRSGEAIYLFGYGDGGGGADAGMIERLMRATDLQGVPRARIAAPESFFERLEIRVDDLAAIEGELYFEYHRGTYTSQGEIKRLNRLSEGGLQALEFLSVACALAGRAAPGRDEVEALWRVLLTNQFHDILPGSSIGLVNATAVAQLSALAEDVAAVNAGLLAGIADGGGEATPVNPIGFARSEVTERPDGAVVFAVAEPFAAGRVAEAPDSVSVREREDGSLRLENAHLSALVSRGGEVLSLVHRESGREALAGPANRMILFDDHPTAFDAWDIDPFALETARDAPTSHRCEVVSRGPLRAEVRFERRIGAASTLAQNVRLDAGARRLEFHTVLDWHERNRWLKAVFPVACRSPQATFETLFGAVERPTHQNTDADLARYEVPGHRWADLSEPGFGVSLLSDSRYGFSVLGGEMGLSLARAPTSPDPSADEGEHGFGYALYPHQGDWRDGGTVAEGAGFNRPLLWAPGSPADVLRTPLVSAIPTHVVVDGIKPAEDGEGWVVRLYESIGARVRARLSFGPAVTMANVSNTLEDRLEPLALEGGACDVDLRGFQLMTIRVG
jgi:alpha-mannosidase